MEALKWVRFSNSSRLMHVDGSGLKAESKTKPKQQALQPYFTVIPGDKDTNVLKQQQNRDPEFSLASLMTF